ncbi:hypothetical protein F4825DRAFT_457793 [Nemania diffusa]|nr:hypothetical protein F4825DRAFT_457793 [Nemania diffusa]
MSPTIQTSRTSSPPAGLRPAPLRVPLRKTAASLNGNDPRPVVTEDSGGERHNPTTTSPGREIIPQFQSDIPPSLSHRRSTSSKVESLLSRFESLDVVNTEDTRLPHNINGSYGARVAASKQKLPSSSTNHLPIDSIRRVSSTSTSSPRHIRTYANFSYKSTLPVSTQPIAIAPNVTDRVQSDHNSKSAYTRVPYRDDEDMDTDEQLTSHPSSSYFTPHTHSPYTASAIPVLRHPRSFITSKGSASRRLQKSKSFRMTSPSLSPSSPASVTSFRPTTKPNLTKEISEKPGAQRSSNDLKSLLESSTAPLPHRPSVADLRQSFEKISHGAEPPGGSARLSLPSRPIGHSVRQSQDMPLSATLKHLPGPSVAERSSMLPVRTSCSHPPLFGRGQIVYVRPKTRMNEPSSPLRPVEDAIGAEPSPSLLRTRRCDSQEPLLEKAKISHEPLELEQLSPSGNEKVLHGEENSINFELSMDGLGEISLRDPRKDENLAETPKVQRERSIRRHASGRSPLRIFRSPKALSPSRRTVHRSGKVSQLRKLFERSSGRFSSPLSLMSIRSRLDSEEYTDELTGDCLSSSWNESESPTSTHTIARRRSMVPSLTTEISVNDFFCDFVGGLSHEASSIIASPSATAVEAEPRMKHESPVKDRILKFEHLSRDSLKVGKAKDYREKTSDTRISFVSKSGNKKGGKRNTVRGWRPIHQKGTAIWRKISSPFSRSSDSWKDCKSEHEHTNLNTGTSCNSSLDRLSPLANDSRRQPCRSSSFGYSMYRVPHTSPQSVPTSQTTPNIQSGLGNSSNRHLEKTSDVSNSNSCPDTPPIRKSFPIKTWVSSGLRHTSWFGLDGHFMSKPVRDEDFRSSEATTPRPGTPHGDPSALRKVMLKQSVEERNRRRQEEKQLHRDQKLRTLGRWKGKGKAKAVAPATGDAVLTEEVGKKHDKGKGKEKSHKCLKKNEAQESNGSANETNEKTESGFVVFESKDVKLRHPKPRRPGQVRKLANMYRDKGSSGVSVNTKASSGATLKESRQSFRQKASSALGLGSRKGSGTAG